MKGLLIKDVKLMMVQKRFIILIVCLAICLGTFMYDISYILGYMAFIMPMLALGTISYDEFDNGNAFLFSLPISRRGYVREKYVLCLLMGAASILIGIVLSLVIGTIKGSEMIPEVLMATPAIFGFVCLMIALMMPLQLKFGAEKSKMLLAGAMGVIFAAGMSISSGLASLDMDVAALMEQALTLHTGVMIAAAAALVLAALAASMAISVRIMEKKEF